MPDNKPQQPSEPEPKKDTVRINLPAGVTGKPPQKPGAATQPVGSSAVTQPLAPPVPPVKPAMPDVTQPITPPGVTQPISSAAGESAEAKKETAVMGKPPASPAPKADTSRVQVSAAKPSVPEMPRPTVKLRREGEVAAAPSAATAAPSALPVAQQPAKVVSGPGGADVGLAVLTMLLALGVAGYLAFLTMG